jgi:uncharacterized protein (DUF58 family)
MMRWALGGLVVGLLGVVVGSPVVVIIGAAAVAVRVLAEQWPLHVIERLEFEHRFVPSKTVVGEDVELRLTLWNKSRLPTPLAVAQDTLSDELQAAEVTPTIALPLRPFERATRRVRVRPLRRGVHSAGPADLEVPALFGTSVLGAPSPVDTTLLIARPLAVPVSGTTVQAASLAQARVRRSLFVDPTLFAGVRPYQSGDPRRSIHWRASARVGTRQTKRYEPALARHQMIVLDVQTIEGPHWRLDHDEALFEDLCVATLSLARSLITADSACGLAAAGFSRTTQRYAYLPPRADRAQIERIADVLARLAYESSAPLGQLLGWLPQRLATGTTISVISGRSAASSARVMRRLRSSGFPVHFIALGERQDHASEARTLGLAGWSALLRTERGRPTSLALSS